MSSSGDDSEDDEGVRTWDQFLAESDGRYAETVRINLADDLKYAPTSSSLPSKKSICYGMCPTADASRLIYVRCTRCDKVVRDVGIAHHLQSRHNYRPQNAVTDYYGDSGDDYQGFLLSPAHCPNVPSTSAEGVGPNKNQSRFSLTNILLLETNNNLGSPCTSSSRDVSEPMEDTKVKIQKVTRSRKKAMKEPKIKTVIKIEEGSADDASSTGETERFEEKPLHKHPIGANHRVLRSSHSGENGIVFAPTVTTDTFSDGRSMTRSGLLFHDSVSDLVHAESRKRRSRQQFADDDFNLDIKRPKAEIEEIPEEHRLQPTDLEIPKTTRKVLLPRKNGTSIRNKTLGTMPRAIHKDQRADFTHASTPLNGSPSTRFRCENKNVHPASSSKRTSNEGHHAVSKFFSDFLEKTESRVDRSTSKNVDNRHHPKYVANKMLNKRNYSDDHDSNRFLTGANSIL
ncbi:hypothetical protein L596_011022 [Steinernema carpocapsae]|uniref:Uncharacterized protein n=1 Tax=Steinernema carpocapsae TaxID=34508 RepID=A0A4U5NRP3_STECR|nr:hypothetical protein L596_011022 [Steinernema carpocapsae]